ncbi:MAG: cytochrome P450 [Myxococcota bacterium]
MFEATLRSLEAAGTSIVNLWSARTEPLELFLRSARKGPLVLEHIGPFDLHIVSDPALAEQILQQPDVYTKDTRGERLLRAALGIGLVTAQGPVWRERRRLAQPAFRRPKLEVYAKVMEEECEALAERWEARGDEVFDVGHDMMQLTLKIATRCLFDDDLDGEAETVDAALQEILSCYLRMATQPFARPERLPVGPAASYRRAVGVLHAVVARLVARRRAKGSDGDDLLHLWLASDLDDDAIRDEVVTMLLAAHETTANLLTWAWTLLSRNPTALRRLQDEVASASSSDFLARNGLPWTDAVVSETLRIYPPIWMTARSAATDALIGDHAVRAGSTVAIPVYAMHHDNRHWPHPEGFDPQRWLSKDTSSGPFLPFGAGPRKCIGSHFAMLEARIALAVLAKRFDVQLVPGQSLAMLPSVTLRPADPILATLTSR